MSRKTIKLKFVDAYPGHKPETSPLLRAIEPYFDIELSDNPDYIIAQPYGHEHLKYDNCVKLFFTGENVTPDFNLFDYAIGFDHLDFGDRYVRVPLWAVRSNFSTFRKATAPSDEQLVNRRFCSFVVSNAKGDPIRTKFFHELSKYKRVDSGGYHLNNVGGPVKDKLEFVSGYKFNIAFENSSYPGYTTEKLMDPLSVWSVPVYWGDSQVESDFRGEAMVRVTSYDDIQSAIDEIIRLDNNDEEYLAKCKVQCLANPDPEYYRNRLRDFLCGIFDKPVESARRRCAYGCQGEFYLPITQKAFKAYDVAELPIKCLQKVRRMLVRP